MKFYRIKIDKFEKDEDVVVINTNGIELILRKDQARNFTTTEISGEKIKTVEIDLNVAVQRGLYFG